MESLVKLHKMHLDEDSVFSTTKTNDLLERHMRQEEDMHQANVLAIKELNRTIKELTHYVKWLTSQTVDKSAPPFVSEAG